MRNYSHLACLVFLPCIGLWSLAANAASNAYPTKPIRFIVPFPPGGASDILSRMIAQKLTEKWTQPVIVDNRAGAGGNIGAGIVAKSARDGYTILLGYVGTLAINQSLYRNLPFDTLRDFTPVTNLVMQPLVLVSSASVPAKTVSELIDLAKAKPGELSYASVGTGSAQHLAGEMLKSMARIDILHVPYKGSAPGLTDLLAGQVQLMFVGVSAALPHINSGKIRALAVASAKRAEVLPNIPMIGETVTGFEIRSWNGVLVPAGTPASIVEVLHHEITKILSISAIRERLLGLGFEIDGSSPAQFAAMIRSDITKWASAVQKSGAHME